MKQQQEKKDVKGTVQGLGAEEQALVDLARGCDSFQVQVCPGIHGSALYRALKESFISCHGDLKTAGWPCLLTNRMGQACTSEASRATPPLRTT